MMEILTMQRESTRGSNDKEIGHIKGKDGRWHFRHVRINTHGVNLIVLIPLRGEVEQ
jgi:hypothetical protein